MIFTKKHSFFFSALSKEKQTQMEDFIQRNSSESSKGQRRISSQEVAAVHITSCSNSSPNSSTSTYTSTSTIYPSLSSLLDCDFDNSFISLPKKKIQPIKYLIKMKKIKILKKRQKTKKEIKKKKLEQSIQQKNCCMKK
jgi:hypothetical protein